jgi:hypothetical protein
MYTALWNPCAGQSHNGKIRKRKPLLKAPTLLTPTLQTAAITIDNHAPYTKATHHTAPNKATTADAVAPYGIPLLRYVESIRKLDIDQQIILKRSNKQLSKRSLIAPKLTSPLAKNNRPQLQIRMTRITMINSRHS